MIEPAWCLICSDRPADGVLRRVYMDDGEDVATKHLPHFCEECAEPFEGKPAKPEGGRKTFHAFEAFPKFDTAKRAV